MTLLGVGRARRCGEGGRHGNRGTRGRPCQFNRPVAIVSPLSHGRYNPRDQINLPPALCPSLSGAPRPPPPPALPTPPSSFGQLLCLPLSHPITPRPNLSTTSPPNSSAPPPTQPHTRVHPIPQHSLHPPHPLANQLAVRQKATPAAWVSPTTRVLSSTTPIAPPCPRTISPAMASLADPSKVQPMDVTNLNDPNRSNRRVA